MPSAVHGETLAACQAAGSRPLWLRSHHWVGEAGRQGEGLHVFQEELKIWIFMFSFLMFSILASL